MPGFLSKAMDYLGLSDNDAYGEYEPYQDQAPPPTRRQPERNSYDYEQPTVRAVPVVAVESGIGLVTVQPARSAPVPSSGSVRPLPGNSGAKLHSVTPKSFADAQEIGERFRAGHTVLVNLGEVERETKRRLIDFAAGLIFGLSGAMERVSDVVYTLNPRDASVPSAVDDRLRTP